MYEITVKWPDGQQATVDGFTDEQCEPMMDFLWAAGADDVRRVCTCGTCETCSDHAAWHSL